MEEKTYVAIQRGGHYSNACQRRYWMTVDDCAVIEYGQFIKFINTGEATQPVFVSPHYGVCRDVARELNESASAIHTQRELAEWVANRAKE